MRYVLSAAVLTSSGQFEYKLVNAMTASIWLRNGEYTSAIRIPEIARLLRYLTGLKILPNHERIAMQPGHQALVCRLVCSSDSAFHELLKKGRQDAKALKDNCAWAAHAFDVSGRQSRYSQPANNLGNRRRQACASGSRRKSQT
jgi:hypothetical protein